MKNAKYLLAILAASGTLSLCALADNNDDQKCDRNHYQHEMWDEGGPEHGPMGHHGFDKTLGLTDAQKKTLNDDRAAQEKTMRDLHEKLRAAHDDLEKAAENNASDAELNKLAANSASLIAQQEVLRVKNHQKFLSLLTPEQKTKLSQWETEHKDRMKDHPHP